MTFETLDDLFDALVYEPENYERVLIIADCLDELEHPAAGWWRTGVQCLRRVHGDYWRPLWKDGDALTLIVTGKHTKRYPGILDLVARIDRATKKRDPRVGTLGPPPERGMRFENTFWD